MLLTLEQSVDLARERYHTFLTEVAEERKARQARLPPVHRVTQVARHALVWLGARLPAVRQDRQAAQS